MNSLTKIDKLLEKRKKEYQGTINETKILSQMLMNKDKRELVGISMSIFFSGGIKKWNFLKNLKI